MTREQFAQLLYNDADKPQTDGTLSSFPDAGQVSGWATDALTWAVEEGIVSGQKTGATVILNPRATATRAEAASMMKQYIA